MDTISRPYQFLKFDRVIKKKDKEFANPNSRSNESRLHEDLVDIHNIMKKNITEVLKRGEGLDTMRDVSDKLKRESSQ